jgi:hypothetical protein
MFLSTFSFTQGPHEDSFESPQSKEMKSELDTFDPLKLLHVYVHSLIFQHFDGSDLLKISEVSTDWNYATYEQLMDKIKFNLDLTEDLR